MTKQEVLPVGGCGSLLVAAEDGLSLFSTDLVPVWQGHRDQLTPGITKLTLCVSKLLLGTCKLTANVVELLAAAELLVKEAAL